MTQVSPWKMPAGTMHVPTTVMAYSSPSGQARMRWTRSGTERANASSAALRRGMTGGAAERGVGCGTIAACSLWLADLGADGSGDGPGGGDHAGPADRHHADGRVGGGGLDHPAGADRDGDVVDRRRVVRSAGV